MWHFIVCDQVLLAASGYDDISWVLLIVLFAGHK